MSNKIFTFIITFLFSVCVLANATSALAMTGARTGEESVDPPTDPPTQATTEVPILRPTKPTTTKPTTTKPTTRPVTQRFTKPENDTTRRPVRDEDDETTRRPATTKRDEESQRPSRPTEGNQSTRESSSATTPEETLPEGSFLVYVELNNGQPRLRRIMDKPGLVPEPSEPERPGYVFQGWYADSKFSKPWNFFVDYGKEGTVIYAKWEIDSSTTEYKITVKDISGGKIEVNPATATEDEYVVINVTPDEGKRLIVGSLTINGEPTDVLSFLMPDGDVVIDAKFEDIPAEAVEEEKRSIAPFVIGGIVAFLVIAAIIVIVVVNNGRNQITEEDIDENGTIIDDDDTDWFDESIVIEDGFKEGEKVIGNVTFEDDFDNEEYYEDDE